MRFVLCGINAKYIHSNLAIFSLKAYAEQKKIAGADIVLKEYTINHYVEDILQDLYACRADVIIFSCYIWNISYVRELAAELKKVSPEIKIWAGGPEVSYHAEKFLEGNPAIDLVMQGEGEEVFSRLVRFAVEINSASGKRALLEETKQEEAAALSEELRENTVMNTAEIAIIACAGVMKKELCDFPGVAFRRGREIINNGFAPLMDMDALPFVYEDFQLFEHKILYYETSRGCPFRCSYCLSSVDKTVRFRSLSLVKEELALFARMRPGLIQLEIGVQSTNEATIGAIYRHMDLGKLFSNVDKVHALGNIHQHLDFIAGLPFEDYERFGKSFDDLYVHAPDQLQLGFLKVLKGTVMEEEATRYGIVYRSLPPYEVLKTRWLSYDEVILLKGIEELVELYYNSGQYTYTLRYVIPRFESPFRFFERFSADYREKGYHKVNHSRLEKYNILRDFLREHLEEAQREFLDEIMIYDMYLRENVKGRPSWAAELSSYKKEWRELYRTEGRRLFPHQFSQADASGKNGYDSKKAANGSHIEPFSFDVEKMEKTGEIERKNVFCLFDYSCRNPLNRAARTVVWENSAAGETIGEGEGRDRSKIS